MTEQTDNNKKKLFTTKNIMIGCGSLLLLSLVCVGIGSILDSSPSGQATNTAEVIAQATEDARPPDTTTPLPPTDTPAATLNPEESLEYQIREILGSSNRDIPRIEEVKPICVDSGCDITVKWALNDNLTSDMRIYSAQRDATDILEVISNSELPLEYVRLAGTFSMVDSYGNVSEDIVLKLFFSPETIEMINFENFLVDNIYKIADGKDIHPELIPD